MIITANPTNVEHMLKTNFQNYPKGAPFTDVLGDFLGMGIFNVDGELWSTQRKLASHEFSMKSLREFVVNVLEEEITTRLIPLLDIFSKNNEVLDMQDVLRRLAFDTICKISLGWDPCFLDFTRSTVSPLAAAFDVAAEATAVRGKAAANKWVWKVKKLLNVGSERKLKEAVGVIHFAVNDIIRKRRENMDGSESERDLLSRFISAGHDDELVRDMVISFLMAGRDTTSAAMTWLFWLLTWHPTIEKDLLNEITSMIKEYDHLSLSFDDLKEMDYLKACLCETMRLYPPVVWDSKHAAENDVLPDGTPVYKGNRVMYFPYGMGRMENLWGKDCLEFRPDRWFSESGVFKMENPYKFSVFQAGPRVCLGKEMAFMQMKYVVASVLRRFELVPVSLDQPVFVPLLTAHMDGGLKVRVRKRSE
ncbi:cytochrome P450 94B3-like protein [Tanacetum coccineum]